MKVFWPDWSRIHQEGSKAPCSPLLAFFSSLYGLGVKIRLAAYNRRLFKKRSLPGFVVSIGNLTTGGTGKTPAVVMLAKWAQGEGFRVAILSRGYKGKYKGGSLEVSDGHRIKANPKETGDEPYLLAKELSGIPVVISRRRFLGGLFANRKFGTDFFILDDGFQHLELERDLNLALIDATDPFGNGHLLPMGPLRESVGQLVRADAVILTRFSGNGSEDRVLGFLKSKFPGIPIFCADHLPANIVFPHSGEVHEAALLKGRPVLAFAGIARPEVFKDTLIRLGADLVCFKGFRDHYQFKRDEIRALIRMKETSRAQYLLTTEKDWVRMASFAPACPDLGYLCIKFALLPGQDDDFFRIIKDGISKDRKLE